MNIVDLCFGRIVELNTKKGCTRLTSTVTRIKVLKLLLPSVVPFNLFSVFYFIKNNSFLL